MDKGLRSNEVFIKKKSSSGCLIIKKQIGSSSGGVGRLPRKGFLSNESRGLGISDSGSSEESLEPNRRGILPRDERFYNGSEIYSKGVMENKIGEFDGLRRRKIDDVAFGKNVAMYGEGISGNNRFGRNAECESENRRRFEGILGNNEFEGERRRKFNDVKFDENVGYCGERMRNDDTEDRHVNRREFETMSGGYGRNSSCFGNEGGVGPLPRKVFLSNEERQSRGFGRRVSASSEDSLEPGRRGILPRDDRVFDGSTMYGKGTLGNDRFGRNKEFEGERRRNFDDAASGEDVGMSGKRIVGNNRFGRNGEFEGERTRKFEGILGDNRFVRNGEFDGERRRKFDDVEFDENLGVYGKRMRKDHTEDGYAIRRDFENGSGRYGMDENRNSPYIGITSANEARLPVLPLRRVTSDKPIRVQGKNGVLKVMVNKSKNAHILRQFYDKYIEDEDKSGPKSDIAVNNELSVGPSLYLDLKHCQNSGSSGRIEKTEPKVKKYLSKRISGDLDMHTTDRSYDYQQQDLVRRSSNLEIDINKSAPITPVFFSDSNVLKKGNSLLKGEKSEIKLQKRSFKRPDTGDSGTDDSDPSLKPKVSHDYQHQDLVRRGSNLEIDVNNKSPVTPAFCSDSKLLKKGHLLLNGEKSDTKLQSLSSKRDIKDNSETEDSDPLSKREGRDERFGSSSKGVKSEEKTPLVERAFLVKDKETKVKRGTGTEKQLLREKIRHLLLKSGWTINYKPRKNRDYQDAVYVNPAGTAYWSIIKAYEAFKKQVGEEDVPEESLNKLTRQTRKKMEKELKFKQREDVIGKDVPKEEVEEDTEDDNNEEKQSFSKKKNDTSFHVIQQDNKYDNNHEKRSSSTKQNGKSLKQKGEKPSLATGSCMVQGRKTQQMGRSTLLVRGYDKKGSISQNDNYVPYMGKRTLLSWLIDSGTVQERAQVEYMNRKRTKVMLKGWVFKNGIHCSCCNKILTVSKFEVHAKSKLHQPFQNIYLENGVSLLQCQLEAWNKQDMEKRCGFHNLNIDDDDENDDACGLCGDGGDLMCCDGCPSTFHQSCIGIQTLPSGDWHCPNCMCKFCERSTAQGNALLTCILCERKYHKSCKEEIDALSADIDRDTTFCGKKCLEVYEQLQKLLEVKHELEAGFSWSLIHRTDIDTDTTHLGFPQKVECNSKLAVALSVIEECFLPISDRRSNLNLIHNVLYNRGSNYSRLNHSGFYTATLERGDEIIAVASIRIHGTQVAEMPFIGTRHVYRRQGMCRRLLCAVESALHSLKVGKLIIPAIAEDMHTWTGVFGFKPLEESLKKEMRSLNMLVFPRIEMLQKTPVGQNTIKEHSTASGAKSSLTKEQQPKFKRSSICDSSSGYFSNVGDYSCPKCPPKTDDKTALKKSCVRINVSNENASSNSSSDIPS